MNKEDRMQVFTGYGYINLGEGENEETLVFKRFDDGSGLIMAVHDKYTTQIKMDIDSIKRFCACAIETNE
jgi:hypothetical protein